MNDSNLKDFNPLCLDKQLCFALYVCSKEIIKLYGPILDKVGLTYTSYITLMSLWEKDNVTVKQLGKTLYLDSGTLTPLLKKLESQNLVERVRSREDERTVYILLTEEGRKMKEKCADVPQQMMCKNLLNPQKGSELLSSLHTLMEKLCP